MKLTEAIEATTTNALFDKSKLFLKALIIFVMAFALWVPTNLITNMVNEREERQKEAIADISSKWAGKQTITGPLLVIPYIDSIQNVNGKTTYEKVNSYFLPEKLNIRSNVTPEKRYRGIYEVAVYRSNISITGSFNKIPWEQLKIPAEKYLWNEATLVFSVRDNQKGLNEDVSIQWDGAAY